MDELSSELSLLSRLMDAAALRTRVIADNMANVNTPGFKRSKVVFEETLSESLRRGNRAEAEDLRPKVEEEKGGEVKPDGNNVHMEDEIADLMKATILYNTLTRIMSERINVLQTAIRGRS